MPHIVGVITAGSVSATPGPGAGTGTVSLLGTDVGGNITITVVGTGSANGTVAKIVFSRPFLGAPKAIILTPGNANAASNGIAAGNASQPFVAGITTTSFIIKGNAIGMPAGTYVYYYVIIQ